MADDKKNSENKEKLRKSFLNEKDPEKKLSYAKSLLEIGEYPTLLGFLWTFEEDKNFREFKITLLSLIAEHVGSNELSDEINDQFRFLFIEYIERDPKIASACLDVLGAGGEKNVDFFLLVTPGKLKDKDGRERQISKKLQEKAIFYLLSKGKNFSENAKLRIINYVKNEAKDPKYLITFLEFVRSVDTWVKNEDVRKILDDVYEKSWVRFNAEEKIKIINLSWKIYPSLTVKIMFNVDEDVKVRLAAFSMVEEHYSELDEPTRRSILRDFPKTLRENSIEIKIAAINLARGIESLDLVGELADCLKYDPSIEVKKAAISALAEIIEGRVGREGQFIKSVCESSTVTALEVIANVIKDEKLKEDCYNALEKIIISVPTPETVKYCLSSDSSELRDATFRIIAENPETFLDVKGIIDNAYNDAERTERSNELILAYYSLNPDKKITNEEADRIFLFYMRIEPEQLANACIEVLSNAEDPTYIIQTLIKDYIPPKGQEEASRKKLKALEDNINLVAGRNKMPEFTVQ